MELITNFTRSKPFNLTTSSIHYLKVSINKSLCNSLCEIVNGEFCMWVDLELGPTYPRAFCTANLDFVSLEIDDSKTLDGVMANRFIKTSETNIV